MDNPTIVAEQSLIGAVLMNSAAFDAVDGRVAASDFKEPIHQRLWEVFSKARQNGQALDYKLAISALGSDAKVEILPEFTVGRYVAKLAAEATTVVNCRDYASVVRQSADFRRMADVADDIRNHVARPEVSSPEEVARLCIERLDAIVSVNTSRSSQSMSAGEAAKISFDRMMEAKRMGKPQMGVPYGLVDLDHATLGMWKGQMILVGGRPSMGKSAVGVAFALNAAEAGYGVAFFALEMSADMMTDRALASLAYDNRRPLSYMDIKAGNVSDEQCEELGRAALHLDEISLHIDPQPGLTVGQIVARSRKLKSRLEADGKSLDVVIVDHVGLVASSDRYAGNRVNEVTEISGALKAMAKDLDLAVMVMCQLNRGNEAREDKRPQLSDLRDSGALEQDADVVMFVYREEYYLDRKKCTDAASEGERLNRLDAVRNTMEIAIAKQRQGPIQICTVFCDIGANAIRNLGR
ncbi:replicative DNA helicase [Xanthobacter sp. ZOL 2024]